jgi:hypothetical protein
MKLDTRSPLRSFLVGAALLAACALPAWTFAGDPGRLFYTPQQRAQLEAARVRKPSPPTAAVPVVDTPPVVFDGVVMRSDGAKTSWVNGRAHSGTSLATGLKPGQIRAGGKVYEPYQVLRDNPSESTREAAAP